METKVYNQKGTETGKILLPVDVFGLPWNADLVHQVVTSMLSSARKNIAHTKNRGDVRGGGKKPWQQKGTGRARHGSSRSPLWVGGGVTHGPRNDKNFERKVSKKMKAKALFTILSRKYKDGEILFIDTISITTPKTKDAVAMLGSLGSIKGFENISTKKNNSAIIALNEKSVSTEKSFRNIGSVLVDEVRNINPVDLLNYKYLVLTAPEESVSFISKKLSSKEVEAQTIKKVEKKVEKVAKKSVTKKSK